MAPVKRVQEPRVLVGNGQLRSVELRAQETIWGETGAFMGILDLGTEHGGKISAREVL